MAKIEIIKKELVSIENFFESKKDEISSSMYSKELNKIFKDLSRIRKEIDSETYFISIIGGIKTGKSTLINLLCHKNVSTTRAGVETTKRPVIVSVGDEDKIVIFKKEEISALNVDDNDRNLVIDYVKGLDTILPDSIKIIKKDLEEEEISNILTDSSDPDLDKIILVNITVNKNHLNEYNHCLLKNKIMFIDTPGLDGLDSSVGGMNNNNGYWLLNRVDLSIILQSTVSPISNTLDYYLKKLHEKEKKDINYMLVHNKFSLKNWLKDISQFENDINKNSIKKALEILHKIEQKKYVCKEVDLAKAEDGFEKSDTELKIDKDTLLEESNFEIFEKEIYKLIEENKKKSHIKKCVSDLETFITNNEFKFKILDNLEKEKNEYKQKYKILKDSFDWDKVRTQIEKDLDEPWDKEKQPFDDGFHFNKHIDIFDEINANDILISEFKQAIKKSFLESSKKTNLVQYLLKRNINNEVVESLIDQFEIKFEKIIKGIFLKKDQINNISLEKYLLDKVDDFITKKMKEMDEKITLSFYEAKKYSFKDDVSEAKLKLKTKTKEFLSQMRNELLILLRKIFDDFHFHLDAKEGFYLEKFIGENSKIKNTEVLLNEIENYLNILKKQVELN